MLTYPDACKACGSTEWNFQAVAASEQTAAYAAEDDALNSKEAGEVRRCAHPCVAGTTVLAYVSIRQHTSAYVSIHAGGTAGTPVLAFWYKGTYTDT